MEKYSCICYLQASECHNRWISNVTDSCAFCSFVFTGPVTHYMYQMLEQVVSKSSQCSSLKKVVIDRLLFAPPYLLVLFYSVAIMEVSYLCGKGSSRINTQLLLHNVCAFFICRVSHTMKLGRKSRLCTGQLLLET